MKSMEARYRLVRVAFWLRNGWCKPATDDLVVINDRYWVALLCDAMLCAGAAWAHRWSKAMVCERMS